MAKPTIESGANKNHHIPPSRIPIKIGTIVLGTKKATKSKQNNPKISNPDMILSLSS